MKKLLIISPYFVPLNAADSHRVRMSLPYFKQFGWHAEVVTVDSIDSDLVKDPLLLESIPQETIVHKVQAFPKKWTSKLGLGSIALRSLWFYFKYVNKLLSQNNFDLIYFSTTQFPVCILGRYWKKKYQIPYLIDMQDPWHSNYYKDKPKVERPSKYWFSYHLDKYLEPFALKRVAGLIAVNQIYIEELKIRYPNIKNVPEATITFSSSALDFKIAKKNERDFLSHFNKNDKLKISYVGAVGTIMNESVKKILIALRYFVEKNKTYQNGIELYFLGTSYAPDDKGVASIIPLAEELGVISYIIERTQRLPYYSAISHMIKSDALLILGSDNPGYIGSKIYNTLAANKPVYSLLHQDSPANNLLKNYSSVSRSYLQSDQDRINSEFSTFILKMEKGLKIVNNNIFEALDMTKSQCKVFNNIINN